MEPTKTNNSKKLGIGIAVVAVLALIGITVATENNSAVPANTSTSTATALPADTTGSNSVPPITAGSTAAALYKDGTYTATGSYMSPGGADQVGVTVTLKNDIITSATVTPMPGDNESARYQAMFAANYKQYVVGQDITQLNVHKVSGSSLTSQGFNAAIAQIEAQAKA